MVWLRLEGQFRASYFNEFQPYIYMITVGRQPRVFIARLWVVA